MVIATLLVTGTFM